MRDLHDGTQQRLMTLRINLELAAEHLERDAEGGIQLLRALGDEIEDALEEIRGLAAGIFPALLSDAGLGEALDSVARRGPVPTILKTEGLRRYRLDIESAVYFCCIEALQNSAQHATDGSELIIRLRDDGSRLSFEVADDGASVRHDEVTAHGAEARQATWDIPGSGLTDMNDRLRAVGGRLWIESSRGRGTVVHGEISVSDDALLPADEQA